MNSCILRRLWSVVEETQTPVILELNDADLVQQLLHQFQNRHALTRTEAQAVRCYLGDRLALIRDMVR
ncbi:hypothetical protein [Altericista sp. CCNU0014]|uniref:hypothetical protein n=1 Tax=Altericista sp. CCNU0014 TaxID=3082949 RepID=UPI00384B5DBC